MRIRGLLALVLASGLVVTAVAGCDVSAPAPVTAPSSTPAITIADPHMITDVSTFIDLPDPKAAPAGAALDGPSYRFHIVETATTVFLDGDFLPYFKTGDATPAGPVSAGPDNEFLLIRLSGQVGKKAYVMFPAPLTDNEQVKIRVGDETRVMPGLQGSDGVLLLVVPIGSPVTLAVTEAGRTQSIDLRTGKPDAQSAALAAGSAEGEANWDVYGRYPGDKIGGQVNVKASAYLTPFDGTYAKPGKIWLDVNLELSYWSWRELGGSLNAAKSIQVKVGGRTLTVDAEATDFELLTSGTPNLYQNELYAKVQVPKDGVRKVSVRFVPVGGLTLDGEPARFQPSSAPTETITLK
ncbi:hypothetical protein [Actinoplanes flavus]|uniref:DUF4382 domain-containing protein n=1 Tax=Actinoplanes flavus TaxID=2820290 RepID=A0ABS3V0B3_9ACTN|nr:hypothetical protein [Actinoplanes flavus]MBO3744268.1 hypothetical protein [Actinoplanes flavus]